MTTVPEDIIRSVYQAFDPEPLNPDATDLYVELDSVRGHTGVVKKLSSAIIRSSKYTCQLLAGHRGSGKSTELRRLQKFLEEQGYFVVYCEIERDIDPNDVDFPDILIAIAHQLSAQLKDRANITLSPGTFGAIWDRLSKWHQSLAGQANFEHLDFISKLQNLSGMMRNSLETRIAIRNSLEPDTNNLLQAMNSDLIGVGFVQLNDRGYKDLVIIIDDLDKMILKPAKDPSEKSMFNSREKQLQGFKCHMIYTIPIALAYSSEERTLASCYGGGSDIPVVPMVKIALPPPSIERYEPGFEKMRQIIRSRLNKIGVEESSVFASDEDRDELIRLSGGQLREMFSLIREGINDLPLNSDSIRLAARGSRRAYARQLRLDHWDIIDEVRTTGNITRSTDNDQAVRELLDSRAILQYANEEREEWYNINPLIANLEKPTREMPT